MRVLRAYADTGASNGQNFAMTPLRRTEREPQEQRATPSGDSVSLSPEAREMLENGGNSLSVCAQDATYDQYGNVTRQFDALQNELRNLAGKVMFNTDSPGLAGKIGALGSQLASLKAQV